MKNVPQILFPAPLTTNQMFSVMSQAAASANPSRRQIPLQRRLRSVRREPRHMQAMVSLKFLNENVIVLGLGLKSV